MLQVALKMLTIIEAIRGTVLYLKSKSRKVRKTKGFQRWKINQRTVPLIDTSRIPSMSPYAGTCNTQVISVRDRRRKHSMGFRLWKPKIL